VVDVRSDLLPWQLTDQYARLSQSCAVRICTVEDIYLAANTRLLLGIERLTLFPALNISLDGDKSEDTHPDGHALQGGTDSYKERTIYPNVGVEGYMPVGENMAAGGFDESIVDYEEYATSTAPWGLGFPYYDYMYESKTTELTIYPSFTYELSPSIMLIATGFWTPLSRESGTFYYRTASTDRASTPGRRTGASRPGG